MTPEQQAFEDRCWEHYLAERARRTMPGDVEGEPTREGLFWREADGRYGVLAFNTAWQAYQWGMEAVRRQGVPDAVAEVIGCFSAAEDEGLSTALAETSDERLKDLVERRLMYALYACQSLASAPPAPQAEPAGACATCGALQDDQIIKQASAERQEPAAWIRPSGKAMLEAGGYCTVYASDGMSNHSTPLYTHPAQQAKQPLTDEQITAGARALCNRSSEICGVNAQDNWNLESQYFKDDARCVLEAANGIKG